MRGRLICLIGIDGAGKTTLARGVVQGLRERGVRAMGRYGKTVPVLSRLLMAAGRKVFLRKVNVWQDYPRYAAQKKDVMHNPLLLRIYELAVWADYIPQAFFRVVVPLWLGTTVVCDRYLFDVVVGDLAVHSNHNEERAGSALAAGFRLLPRPDRVFLVDLPEEIAIRRKDDVPHVEYLRERRVLYLRLGEIYPMFRLDGQGKPDELVTQVIDTIESGSKQDGRGDGQSSILGG